MPNNKKTYVIYETTQFRRDRKRVCKWGYDPEKLKEVIRMLANGQKPPERYRDHQLKGKLADRRECHITGDWILVYRKEQGKLILSLMRTGRHTDVFNE